MRTAQRKLAGRAMGLEEIKELLRIHARTLLDKYGIRVIGVFGSYTRPTQKKKNDIDLLAEIDRPISLLELVGAEIYLTEILQKKVDLVAKNDLREELKEQILNETMYL
jgi:predicted nucleotidyltransferase